MREGGVAMMAQGLPHVPSPQGDHALPRLAALCEDALRLAVFEGARKRERERELRSWVEKDMG